MFKARLRPAAAATVLLCLWLTLLPSCGGDAAAPIIPLVVASPPAPLATDIPSPVPTITALAPVATLPPIPPTAAPTSTPSVKATAAPAVGAATASRSFAGLLAFVSNRFDHPEIYLYDL